MKRYFYKTNKYMKTWLERQNNILANQQHYFRAAILASINNHANNDISKIYDEIIEMTIKEQFALAQANHIEQCYNHFKVLHNLSRNIPLIQNKINHDRKQILDPNKFPISDLKQTFKTWRSGWLKILPALREELGFQLKVKQSSLDHKQSGKGTFIEFKNDKILLHPGTLIGFVPGSFYHNEFQFKQLNENNKWENFNYLQFPSSRILELTKIEIRPSQTPQEPEFKNPYANGQYINHPPPHESANVCFQQIELPVCFYNSALLKFLPYDYFTKNDQMIPLIGIFTLKKLKNQDQLFVNYLDYYNLPITNIPQWLMEPPPVSPYYQKNQYEYIQPLFLNVLEKIAMKQNAELYEKFKNKISYEPSRHLYETDKQKLRQLIRKKYSNK